MTHLRCVSTPASSPSGLAGRIVVVLNARAGAVRSQDRTALSLRLRDAAEAVGSVVSVDYVDPAALGGTLATIALRDDVDTVIVAGGDGTVSSAGAALAGSGKALVVIPLGTFNLFARAIGMPIGLDAALAALPGLTRQAVDVGRVRDAAGTSRSFLHHLSIGLHPRFIRIRDAMPYASRLGKMLASLKVWRRTIRTLRRVTLTFAGDVIRGPDRFYQAAITVGSFRESPLNFPHADDLTRGDLDLVLLPARGRLDFLVAIFLILLGRWRSNDRLEVTPFRRLRLDARRPRMAASLDGEVIRLLAPLEVEVAPGALVVLRPPA